MGFFFIYFGARDMPVPRPRTNEKKETFINRCMKDSTMNAEYPSNGQRYAVCLTSWTNSKKKKK